MAAILPIDVLRRRARPLPFPSGLDRAAEAGPASVRLRPVASWQLGPSGRVECRWSLGAASAQGLPPD